MANAAQQRTYFLTHTGRMLWGSLYEAKTKDSQGNPLLIKSGPDAGKPTQRFEFAVGFKKTPGLQNAAGIPSWAYEPSQIQGQTSFFLQIYQEGQKAFPSGQYASPTFSWKIIDGDSAVPNGNGNKPCDQEGYAGHWVVVFSSTFAPKICDAKGTRYILEQDAVKPGYYIQVQGSVDGNGNLQKPGVYINHAVISLQGTGPEIIKGPNIGAIGFGQAPAPTGMQPLSAGGLPLPTASFTPPALPGVALPPPAAVGASAPPPALPPVAVQAHPGFLSPPALPQAPTVPPQLPPMPGPPPAACPLGAPQGFKMTEKAQGVRYDAFRSQGWQDVQLTQNGYMVSL